MHRTERMVRGVPFRSAAAPPEEVLVVAEIILGAAVLALLIYGQLRTRPVNAAGLRVIAVLAIVGVVETSQFLQHNHAGRNVRGYQRQPGAGRHVRGPAGRDSPTLAAGRPAWSRGTWLTAALWIVALAAYLGYDALVPHGHGDRGLGAATVVLYLAVSLAIQRLIVQARARRLSAGRFIPASPLGRLS
jgi:hypothetical protein